MHASTWSIVLFIGLCYLLFVLLASRRTRGAAWRPTGGVRGDPAPTVPKGEAWYIESTAPGRRAYSCSFVEFDERGDYLDFRQHQNAWEKIQTLSAEGKQPLLVVTYCHGWKNNSQSSDVVKFASFLGRLANSPMIKERNLRVHGVYIAWRGNLFLPDVDRSATEYTQTKTDFGEAIVGEKFRRRRPFLLWLPEQLSYWSRKGAAEAKVSGVPIARSVFTYANAAKSFCPNSIVFVIGHSFGALMLEKSLGQAGVGALTATWPWMNAAAPPVPLKAPLPFDGVLFVNSAAPSLHAKLLSDLLWAHEAALKRVDPKQARRPVVISVTSSADWATRVMHRIGNLLAPWMTSLQRSYTRGVLATTPPGGEHLPVPQSYFYARTPGHNPLLVDRWIVRAHDDELRSLAVPADVFEFNLRLALTEGTEAVFFTSGANAPTGTRQAGPAGSRTRSTRPVAWKIVRDSVPPGWSQYRGQKPVERGAYWIVRCGHELIADHGDVWSEKAMELYAALYFLR